jgi:hypothetical protein
VTGSRLQAAESTIGEILSDRYRFTIPRYQRPYAWTTDQAGEMFADLLSAAKCEHKLEDSDPYFLGSIVLVKEEGDAGAEVVDGQQRLTTLMTLLSVIRLGVPDVYAASLQKRLFQQGDPIKGTLDQPRLTLRDRDQPFFEKQILDLGAVAQLDGVGLAPLTDSQRNLVQNAQLFRDRLAQLTEPECTRLVRFIDGYTYLVTVATQDFDSAYRIFTVLNERGLDLTHSDILKSEIIGTIPDEAQDAYTAVWEHEEEDLGRQGFSELFGHIRMIFAKTKARETILKEFRESVLSKYPDKRTFINTVLVPSSDAFEAITHGSYAAESGASEINHLLNALNMIDNTDWVPPAISFLSKNGGDDAAVLIFLRDLDRLAASMHIRRLDVSQRIERYGRLLKEIETGADLAAPASALQLDDGERQRTRQVLDGDIYPILRLRMYVMRRLDEALSSGGVTHDYSIISVEHVLPQNPGASSTWRQTFTDEQRAVWTDRLANLVLLTRRKNSELGNREFSEKKIRYFTGGSGVSPFAVTTQVVTEESWTPEVLRRRQTAAVAALGELWRL